MAGEPKPLVALPPMTLTVPWESRPVEDRPGTPQEEADSEEFWDWYERGWEDEPEDL